MTADDPPCPSAEAAALALFEELMQGYGEPIDIIVCARRNRGVRRAV